MARKGIQHDVGPKKAGTPADFLALREYSKIPMMGFNPAGSWRKQSKGKGQAKAK